MLTEPVVLHCIGGFVVCFFYGLARSTADIDYYTAVPANLNLDEVAGEGSALGKKHKVWLHRVAVINLPEDYETRLTEMVPGHFKNLKLLVPDPYDCILSKLERNVPKIETMQTTYSRRKNSFLNGYRKDMKKNCART